MTLPVFAAPSTIMLKDRFGYREERPAFDGNIKPGHFCVGNADGTVRKNNKTSGTDTLLMVAIENSLHGDPITTAYPSGSTVFLYLPKSGDRLYVRVPAAATAIALDAALQLDNTGCVINQAGGGIPKVVALEALDNSGGGAEAFIRVEVI